MKFFTNRSVTKKIVIAILMVLLLTFSIPKPVSADVGGVLLSPLISLVTSVLDGVEHLLEWAMLGKTESFMDTTIDEAEESTTSKDNAVTVEQEVDGSFFGLDAVNVPSIQYTPDNIFANKIPALDINFINPSVTTGNPDYDSEHNIAIKLQSTIASWYVAIRTIALVGLLSVLVYLGIRMLITSVAADRAKYKKMIFDWLVAICLLFLLHYIMSFILTASEVVTSFLTTNTDESVAIYVVQEEKVIDMSLMNYVRFMIQCTDLSNKIGFLALYLMLIIYTVRFTWTYLKRVVNMAFLTIIAPFVALTYPIDKVSDGKAQAFDMWIKEYTFNALLQPLHLLLYTVLLGSATELAVINPLYAIVCLGFILPAEKLLKRMFRFDKASAGTVGSLAGAAAVTTLANKGLMALGKGPHGGKDGGAGKVRTNNHYQREGKDTGANSGYKGFDKLSNQGVPQANTTGKGKNNVPSPDEAQKYKNNSATKQAQKTEQTPKQFEGQEEMDNLGKELDEMEANGAAWNSPEERAAYEEKQAQYEELQRQKNEFEQAQESPEAQEAPSQFAGQTEMDNLEEELAQMEENGAGGAWTSPEYEEKQARYDELQKQKEEFEKAQQPEELELESEPEEPIQPEEEPEPVGTPAVRSAMESLGRFDDDIPLSARDSKEEERARRRREKWLAGKDMGSRFNRTFGAGSKFDNKFGGTIRGIKKAAPTVAYKVARGTLKTATRVALGTTLAATAGVIGATTGDAETAVSMAGAAFGVGATSGGRAFEKTVGKVARDRSVRDRYDAGKYGSVIDARNARADKEYIRSDAHREEWEKYFKDGSNKMTKKDYDAAVMSYRQAGITDTKQIRKALKLEQQYLNDTSRNHGSAKEVREKVQNIAQTYDNIDKKAVYGDANARKNAINNIKGQLRSGDDKQKQNIANEIMQGYVDWHNV